MFGFRKAFTAATFTGESVGDLTLKKALVISQVLGYTLSKYLGVKFLSEFRPEHRAWGLFAAIALAELSLVGFAVVPPGWRVVAIFLNGVPLAVIWGLVFSFLEGRRLSEIFGAGLSCSYIIGSGAAKSVGAEALSRGVPENWMPAVAGLLYLPVFLISIWLLNKVPPPNAEDVAERVQRTRMNSRDRMAFLKEFGAGLLLLFSAYFFVTAYRDYRSDFAPEIFAELSAETEADLKQELAALKSTDRVRADELRTEIEAVVQRYSDTTIFTRTEIPVALLVLAALGSLYLIRDNRKGFFWTHVMMGTGAVLVGVSTLLFDLGHVDGVYWMILVGSGVFLTYVPYGCVLFDRLIAVVRTVGTAVFAIYVADALGYTGTIGVILYKELAYAETSNLDFFRSFSYFTSVVCTGAIAGSWVYFRRRRPHPDLTPPPTAPSPRTAS